MKFFAAWCECGYMAATPEEHPKCRECGNELAIAEKGSPKYEEISNAIANVIRRG